MLLFFLTNKHVGSRAFTVYHFITVNFVQGSVCPITGHHCFVSNQCTFSSTQCPTLALPDFKTAFHYLFQIYYHFLVCNRWRTQYLYQIPDTSGLLNNCVACLWTMDPNRNLIRLMKFSELISLMFLNKILSPCAVSPVIWSLANIDFPGNSHRLSSLISWTSQLQLCLTYSFHDVR